MPGQIKRQGYKSDVPHVMATMDKNFSPIVAAALLVGMLPAQTQLVLPPSHQLEAGTGSTNVPFGRSTPTRVQMAYDARLFSSGVEIEGLAFRLEEGQLASSKMVELEIRISTLGKPVTWMQEDFSRNRGADEVVVLPRQMVTLPALDTAQVPSPFHLELILEQSFVYDPAKGALVIEIIVFSQQPGSFRLDSTFICDSPAETFGPPGCGPSGGPTLKVESVTQQVTWGRPLVLRITGAVPDTATVLFVGTRESGVWNGLELPAELGSIGAPGCFLSLNVSQSFSVAADATGSAQYGLFVPSDPALQGSWLRFQGVAIDRSANALGIVSSQGTKVEICGWEAVSRVFASGLSATTGLREIGVAPVLRLRLR